MRSQGSREKLHFLSGKDLAAEIRNRHISAAAVVEHFIHRIETCDKGKTNLVVVTCYDAARQRAAQADAALARDELWGPLHGVPMTVKENWGMTNVQTTCALDNYTKNRKTGQAELFIPTEDAEVVRRVQNAGAIILGKTNLPMGARDWQSYNDLYGTSLNPWSFDHAPGGSSGGGAGAVAMCLTPLEIGSDIGGSIRTPAHFTGVCGHMPSPGVVDKFGMTPPYPSRFYDDLSRGGPLARCCEDLQLMMDVLAGPAPKLAAGGWSLSLPPPVVTDVSKLRLGVWADDEECQVDTQYAELIRQAGRSLAAQGAKVDFNVRPAVSINESLEVYVPMEAAISLGGTASPSLMHKRRKLAERWEQLFASGFDAILCPVAPTAALKHDHTEPMMGREMLVNGKRRMYVETLAYAATIIIADLPATVVPIGFVEDDGYRLPVGVQIVCPLLQDLTAIEVGKMLERSHERFRSTPPPAAVADTLASNL